MFTWLFGADQFEIPISDRDFELFLVQQSPPPAPAQSLAYDDEPTAGSSSSLNAMQIMFNPQAFKVNFMYYKFHQQLCGKLAD